MSISHWVNGTIALCRYLLALIFLLFGLNGIVRFITIPDFTPFMELMVDSGYIYVVKVSEMTGAIFLFTRKYAPLGLIIIGAVLINILAYHFLLDPRNLELSLLSTVLYLMVFSGHYRKLKGLWQYTEEGS